jgi:plastocyanin
VVWLEPSAGLTSSPPVQRIIHQRNKTFGPHLVAVESGGSVAFPNHDPFFHNAFSNYSGQVFDTGLYAPGTTKVIPFRKTGVARVFCNIHPTMSAVIVVVNTPYFAVTGKDGSYTIADVPPGEYTLRLFSERASESFLDGLVRKVTVSETTALTPIRIADAGYVPPAKHKNKFGKDYPAVIVDQYPGGRR